MIKKRIYYVILVAVLTLVTVSCNKNNDCDISSNISLLANIENSYPDEGTHKTMFESGDIIGIYLVDYENGVPQEIGTYNNYMNEEYVLNDSHWNNFSNNNLTLTDPYTMANMYAYYPYDSQMGIAADKRDLEAYPFSSHTDQSTSLHKSTFLWAKYDSIYIGNTVAKLTFNHLLSKVSINIVSNDSGYNEKDILIENLQTKSVINLNNGKVTANGGINNIIPYIEPVPVDGFENTLSAIVIPQTIAKGTALFSIPNNGILYVYTAEEDLNFKQGTAYQFNMVIGTADPKRVLKTSEGNVIYQEISVAKISPL